MEITEQETKLAIQGARSAARSARGLVSLSDLIGEANLWMVQHLDKVELWREQGRHGANKLRMACRQRCLTVVAAERRLKSRLEAGDMYWYTPGVIREILPDIFDTDDWSTSSAGNPNELRGRSRPAEGNNRHGTPRKYLCTLQHRCVLLWCVCHCVFHVKQCEPTP